MCRLLPKSASATIGHRRINRIGFFLVLPSPPGLLFFMSLPDLIGQSVYCRRLIFQILRSSRSMTTKKRHHPTGPFLPCPVFYFLMSLLDFFFIYVIARLDRAICLSPPLNFPDTPVKPEYDNKKHHHPTGPFLSWPGFLFFMSLPGLTGQSGCLSHNRPS